jgi:S1-C subfamily serine protease
VRISLLLGLLSLACATAPPPAALGEEPTATRAAAPVAEAPPPPKPTCTSFARPGVLRRTLVTRTVDGRLGSWLAGGVVVDPFMQKGRFRGWIVRSLYPNDPCYQEIDLRPGDVVSKVNGKSIERPEQANEVFESLRSAPALVVDFTRAGAPMKLTFQIVEE